MEKTGWVDSLTFLGSIICKEGGCNEPVKFRIVNTQGEKCLTNEEEDNC